MRQLLVHKIFHSPPVRFTDFPGGVTLAEIGVATFARPIPNRLQGLTRPLMLGPQGFYDSPKPQHQQYQCQKAASEGQPTIGGKRGDNQAKKSQGA
ncbi:MAG: hypothetical protein ABR66_00250 [Microbacteriaceae bacterium BACL25 MAG-120322-bin65]|nr:MAG: hypothetical protein ABR66_00250 [Microbacteriaceae bacterium BACL25 MAG-120322-bin65]HAA79776.1 hypothetical protein [Microbacteriaceae bacterium]